MQPRVAYVSPIAQGSESEVRVAHDRFPKESLHAVGAKRVNIFIGSGYYVMVLEFAAGDFQERFSAFTNHPQVRRFFDELGGYLMEALPQSVQPGDSFHAAGPAHGGQATTTARLPLAGEVFAWQA